MNVNLGIWDKLSRLAIGLLLAAGLLAVFFWYLPLIQKNQRIRSQILACDSELDRQEKANRQANAAIYSMRNDPKAVERLAREKLGWARTNEIVVRFQGAPTGSGHQH